MKEKKVKRYVLKQMTSNPESFIIFDYELKQPVNLKQERNLIINLLNQHDIMIKEYSDIDFTEVQKKRGRGRPQGSKNKEKKSQIILDK